MNASITPPSGNHGATFHAHTRILPNGAPAPEAEWEPLFSESSPTGHLNRVAEHCASFCEELLGPNHPESTLLRDWGESAGLLHDLGKFSKAFQDYLRMATTNPGGEILDRVDHSSAGAQWAVNQFGLLGHLLAPTIAGHHSGLLDTISDNACLESRLRKELHPLEAIPTPLLDIKTLPKPSFLNKDPFTLSFFVRMLFSCLVDADFLATEAFMNPGNANLRPGNLQGALQQMEDALNTHFSKPKPDEDGINRLRHQVRTDCLDGAVLPSGFFSLTVPTGGGKTLSSLAFALRHAIRHGQKRVIVVVPFTSIIEQNTAVFRKLFANLPRDWILEHHSNSDLDSETTEGRLATENWEAPLIVTTAVQFYESLYANRVARCRKLHNIANSVILLDEAQTLPVTLLHPCLRALQELTTTYHTSVVLCTATPPAIHHTSDFSIGLKDIREIVREPLPLFNALKRVEIQPLGPLSDDCLAAELLRYDRVLCIVNTRDHAAQIFHRILPAGNAFHLSARMCPAHRASTLDEVHSLLNQNLPVRLVSTQLIEAGVDIDFPIVFRSIAGLDSIAQSAGRCNRNGRLPALGHTFLFQSEHSEHERFFRETANVTSEILALGLDPLSLEAVQRYFDIYYYRRKSDWDRKKILTDDFKLGDKKNPFLFQFASAAAKFRLIDSPQTTVHIPWGKGLALCNEIRNPAIPLNRPLLRHLQRFSVSIYPNTLREHTHAFESARDGAFQLLISPELHYNEHTGLTLDSTPTLIY